MPDISTSKSIDNFTFLRYYADNQRLDNTTAIDYNFQLIVYITELDRKSIQHPVSGVSITYRLSANASMGH